MNNRKKLSSTASSVLAVAFVLALIALVLSATPVAAQPNAERSPATSAEQGEELGTVILDLDKRIGTFREWLDQQAQATKLPPDFAKRVARLTELRGQAETSTSAKAEYEAEFSTLLTEFDHSLEGFVAGKEETFRRIGEMESSLKEGKASMDAAVTSSTKAYEAHAQRAKELVGSLVDSGRRAKAIVDAGGVVSPEAQSAAIQADSMRDTAEFLAEVDKAKADQARAAAEELASQLKELKAVRASFAEDFTNAENGRLKASAIGDYRQQIASSSDLLAQLEKLKKARRKGHGAFDNSAFKSLTEMGPGQTRSSGNADGTTGDNRGLELMLKYAHQGQKPATKQVATTRPTEKKP